MKSIILIALLILAVTSNQLISQNNSVFSLGEKAPNVHHSGDVWLSHLSSGDSIFDYNIAVAKFAAGAKLDWHVHPKGQHLLIIEGQGLYQERGKPIQVVKKGELVKCQPDVEHWHAATPNRGVTYLAITGNQRTLWLENIPEEVYRNIKTDVSINPVTRNNASHIREQSGDINTIFSIGEKIYSNRFIGTPWVNRLFYADSTFNSAVGNVTFAPQTRSNWHKHPSGQILLALDGVGYYQEKGKAIQVIRQGDAVKCPPNVEHWHGASHNDWFVQLAITAEHPEGRVIWLDPVSDEEYQVGQNIRSSQETLKELSNRHRHFVIISSLTVKGDLEKLKPAINNALDDRLSINSIKEVLVHLYAYSGFPRSIQGLKTLLLEVEERKSKGIEDRIGKVASKIDVTIDKYERGKKVLEELTGIPYAPATSGYRAFSPEIDVFLKEHLFADVFERDVLSYQDREITTISALINLGNVEPMIGGHMRIALNIGITKEQITELLNVIAYNIGRRASETGRQILSELKETSMK